MKLKDKNWNSRVNISFDLMKKLNSFPLLIILLFVAAFFLGVGFRVIGGSQVLWQVVRSSPHLLPVKYLKGQLSSPEEMIIDIKHKHFEKLKFIRKRALFKKVLHSEDNFFVPARIKFKDKQMKVKLRLKGDGVDHFEGSKWSFRIKIKDDKTVDGMKVFSIQKPETRNFLNEWLFHQALDAEKLISTKIKFVQIIVNGKNLGIYNLEEHFDKRILERNAFKEGPILKLYEGFQWKNRLEYKDLSEEYSRTRIDVFQKNKLFRNDTLKTQFFAAKNLLKQFLDKEVPVSKAFNIDYLAKFFALTDLFGASHGLRFGNIRFYYNPIEDLLYPIGYDGESGSLLFLGEEPEQSIFSFKRIYNYPLGAMLKHRTDTKLLETFFESEMFFNRYLQELKRVSESGYLKKILLKNRKDLERNRNILYKDYLNSFDIEYLNNNVKIIKKFLKQHELSLTERRHPMCLEKMIKRVG